MIRKLGLRPTRGNYRYITLRIKNAKLDTSHFRTPTRTVLTGIGEEALRVLARESVPYAQVLSKLGLPTTGRPYHELKKHIRTHSIDVSHFKGQSWSRGSTHVTNEAIARGRQRRRIQDAHVFVESSPFYAGSILIPRLLDMGWKYECAWCGVSEWPSVRLVLHLDHANGVHNDNRLENLRLLRPNCHSQTETYRNRRRP